MKIISRYKTEEKTGLGTLVKDNLLLFSLLGNRYALVSASVVQLLQTLTITPVANSVRYFLGSTTFRGEVVPVIDLQSFFYGGSLSLTDGTSVEQKNYITFVHAKKTIIFQVESVFGTIERPEESLITDLVKFASPSENLYFKKAFIDDKERIIVQLDHTQILDRIIHDLEQCQSDFITENQAGFVPIEMPENTEEYNIDLRQKLSTPAPTSTSFGIRKALGSIHQDIRKATLVSVQNLDILIPNKHIIEIFNVTNITKVPNTPKAIVGAVSFRGEVLSALDLVEILTPKSILNRKGIIDHDSDNKVLILEVTNQRIALFVDEIHEIVEMEEADLRPLLASTSEADSNYYFQGVMLDRTGKIILVLDVEYLLQVVTDPVILEQDSMQVVFFHIPKQEMTVKSDVTGEAALSEDNLCVFTLLGTKYALKNILVIQILQNLTITPVATNIHYFIGSTTFRGEVVPIINLKSFFYDKNLLLVSMSINEQQNYIALKSENKTVVFQVESVLGSIRRPEESRVANIAYLPSSFENSYFDKAFIDDEDQIVIQLDHTQILDRIIYELKQGQREFIAENQAHLVPIEMPEHADKYNIDLRQKLSTPAPTASLASTETVYSTQKARRTGLLVSIQNLDVLIPDDHIVEIFNVTNITEPPNVPGAVVGAINFRGEVLSALDLAKILIPSYTSNKNIKKNQETDIEAIILEITGQQIALFVDEIREIVEMEETNLHSLLTYNSGVTSNYYFQGIMLDRTGQIILVLDVEYLFQMVSDPAILDQDSNRVIYFDNPVVDSFRKSTESLEEGLLFEDEGYIYFLDSSFIAQVIEKNAFLFKKYPHDAIKGATIHTNIVPVIDYSNIIGGSQTNLGESKNPVGILVRDPENNMEITFLVDNVVNKLPVDKFDAFQRGVGIAAETLSPIISGFLSYQGSLGMIISPDHLIKEAFTLLQENLQIQNIKEEFSSTILPSELEFLEAIQAKRKEIELLLFYKQKGVRLDYFVFKWGENLLSIDVSNIRRVFASPQWQNVDSKYHPIIGVATIDDIELPIIDLESLLLTSENRNESRSSNYFFSIEYQSHTFLIPVDDIKGVLTTFKEELTPCEDTSIFIQGKKACLHTFSNKKILSLIYIIENKLLNNVFSLIDVDKFLKKFNIE